MDGKAAFLGNAMLPFLDFTVKEFLDFSALQADQVVVMVAFVEFEYGFVAVEMVAYQQARLFELREHTIDRGKTDIQVFIRQQAVHFLGCHVAFIALLEQVENFQAGQRGFETNAFEIRRIAQWGLQIGNANTL